MFVMQAREQSTVLTQWAPTRETPTRLEDQQVPCYNHCWITRWITYTVHSALHTLHTCAQLQPSFFTVDRVHSCLYVLSQIGFKNMEGVQQVPLTQDKAVQLVKDVFISAAERDVYTGDALKICIVTKEGIEEQTIPLRKDWGGKCSPFCALLFGLLFPYSSCCFDSLTSGFLK